MKDRENKHYIRHEDGAGSWADESRLYVVLRDLG